MLFNAFVMKKSRSVIYYSKADNEMQMWMNYGSPWLKQIRESTAQDNNSHQSNVNMSFDYVVLSQ